MLKGTFEAKGPRICATLNQGDIPDFAKHRKIWGTLQRTYNSDKPIVDIELILDKVDSVSIEASPKPAYATRYQVLINEHHLEKVRRGEVLTKEFPLATGVTYFQLSLEGITQEAAAQQQSPQPPQQ